MQSGEHPPNVGGDRHTEHEDVTPKASHRKGYKGNNNGHPSIRSETSASDAYVDALVPMSQSSDDVGTPAQCCAVDATISERGESLYSPHNIGLLEASHLITSESLTSEDGEECSLSFDDDSVISVGDSTTASETYSYEDDEVHIDRGGSTTSHHRKVRRLHGAHDSAQWGVRVERKMRPMFRNSSCEVDTHDTIDDCGDENVTPLQNTMGTSSPSRRQGGTVLRTTPTRAHQHRRVLGSISSSRVTRSSSVTTSKRRPSTTPSQLSPAAMEGLYASSARSRKWRSRRYHTPSPSSSMHPPPSDNVTPSPPAPSSGYTTPVVANAQIIARRSGRGMSSTSSKSCSSGGSTSLEHSTATPNVFSSSGDERSMTTSEYSPGQIPNRLYSGRMGASRIWKNGSAPRRSRRSSRHNRATSVVGGDGRRPPPSPQQPPYNQQQTSWLVKPLLYLAETKILIMLLCSIGLLSVAMTILTNQEMDEMDSGGPGARKHHFLVPPSSSSANAMTSDPRILFETLSSRQLHQRAMSEGAAVFDSQEGIRHPTGGLRGNILADLENEAALRPDLPSFSSLGEMGKSEKWDHSDHGDCDQNDGGKGSSGADKKNGHHHHHGDHHHDNDHHHHQHDDHHHHHQSHHHVSPCLESDSDQARTKSERSISGTSHQRKKGPSLPRWKNFILPRKMDTLRQFESQDRLLHRCGAEGPFNDIQRRVFVPGGFVSQPKFRSIALFPADFTDSTQLYSMLDSGDERTKTMELREPLEQGECIPMQEWQTTFHPSCNGMHEVDMAGLGAEATETLEIFGVKGYWRNAWKLESAMGHEKHKKDTIVLKTLKIEHRFEDAHFEHNRIDAVAMERLTSSPHVINIFGFCGHSVMTEYADGKRLGELADKRKHTPLARLAIARDIATGLADMHGIDGDGNATFVHLDVNPANVVSVGGTLKLNDFNIGILRRWNTTSNSPCGFPAQYPNPQWRSPEEARNDQTLTEKVDVFSMGHIFFRLICGHEPWHKLEPGGRPSHETVNEKVKKGMLPYIPFSVSTSKDPEVRAIRKAMLQCYTFDPTRRPSARAIAQSLQTALDELTG